ncbi:MAG: methylated-DNA--[protein]-cysteine S-methyltransferase [Actinomycetota bacterium]
MTIEAQLLMLNGPAPTTVFPGVTLATGLVEGFGLYDSPLGSLVITFNPNGISSVDLAAGDFGERFQDRFRRPLVEARPPRGWDAQILRAIDEGRPGSLRIDWRSVSPFRQTILQIAATIPRGQVRPYGWLARQAGQPGATRAVGTAMSHNPLPLIVPCHRVVKADGSIGAYSLGGPANKWRLLEVEGASPARLEKQAHQGIRFQGSDTTKIFCYPTCSHGRRITDAHLREFRSSNDAVLAGYRACKVCKPS